MSTAPLSRRVVLEGAGALVVGLFFGGTLEAATFGQSAADLGVPIRDVDPENLDSWLAITATAG